MDKESLEERKDRFNNKILETKELFRNLPCNEAIYLLNCVIEDIKSFRDEKSKDINFTPSE